MIETRFEDDGYPAGAFAAVPAEPRSGRSVSVVAGVDSYPVLACDARGLEVAIEVAQQLPGHVQIHEGGRLVRAALIVAEGVRGDTMRYGFKRTSVARDAAPLDYVV